MRTDAAIDFNLGELELNDSKKYIYHACKFVKEDDYHVYYEIDDISDPINGSIHCHFPYQVLRNKGVKIKITINDMPLVNTSNGSEWLTVCDCSMNPIIGSRLPLIDRELTFKIHFIDNVIVVESIRDTDIQLSQSLFQNTTLLLKSSPGSLFYFPTTGVDLNKCLHGNIVSSDLGERIKNQFLSDAMKVESADINPRTGEINIKTREL